MNNTQKLAHSLDHLAQNIIELKNNITSDEDFEFITKDEPNNEVRIPDHLKSMNPQDFDRICRHGKYSDIKHIIENISLYPNLNNISIFMGLKSAIKYGHINITQFLLEYQEYFLTHNKNEIFRDACKYGQLKIVQLLLSYPNVNPSDKNNLALRDALQYGYTGITKMILNDNNFVFDKLDYDEEYKRIVKEVIDNEYYDSFYLFINHPKIKGVLSKVEKKTE